MKIVSAIILAIAIGWPSAAVAAEKPAIGVTLDGERIKLASSLRKIDGAVYAPVRAMYEALGALVEYDASADMVKVVKGDTLIELSAGRAVAAEGGRQVKLTLAPVRLGNRLYAPVRFVGESIGCIVLWHSSSQTVHLLTGGAKTGADADFVKGIDGKTPDELAQLLRLHIEDKSSFYNGEKDWIKLKLIIGAGADLQRKVRFDTPLDLAVRMRDAELAKLLLEAGADPNARAFDSRSILSRVVNPLYALSGQGDDKSDKEVINDDADLTMLDLLLNYGANPNQLGTSDGTKDPVLLSAIAWNRVAIVERLLEAGAFATAHPDDPYKRSPIDYAAFHDGHLSLVKQFGLDPAQYPTEHPEIKKLLETYAAKAP